MSAELPVTADSLNANEEAKPSKIDVRYKLELTPYLGEPIAKVLESDRSFDVQVVERAAPTRPEIIFEVITEIAGSTLESQVIHGPRRSRTFGDSPSPPRVRVRQAQRRDSYSPPPPPRPRRRISYSPSPPPPLRVDPQIESALRRVEGIEDVHVHQKGKTRLVIHSELLIAILRNVATYFPDESLFGTVVNSVEPYQFLMHHIDAMKNVLVGDSLEEDDLPSAAELGFDDINVIPEARRQTALLLDFLQPTVSEVLVPAERLLARSPPLVTFDMLWYILAPDTMIYVRNNDGPPFAGVVTHCDRAFRGRQARKYEISYWTLTYEDGEFIKVALVADLYHFTGQKEVTSLRICPAKYWDGQDGGECRKTFLERGKRLHEIVRDGPKEVAYDGETFFKNYSDREVMFRGDRVKLEKRKYRGRIIVDIESPSARKFHPTALSKEGYADEEEIIILKPGETTKDSRKVIGGNSAPTKNRPAFATALDTVIRVNHMSPLIDDLYVLLRPHVSGFALSDKLWMLFNIESIQDLQASEDSLDNLVMDLDDLSIIKALSHRQKHSSKAWEADFVRGKGSGQILLLHGPPGVGKTYTVECIAAVFQRPLLVLTIADIGIDEKEVERELTRWLDLATGWGAVVLIDEADVFLEQRQTRDVLRNGLVSVFLRNIEYFRGLLFLTTNRTGQIDDAFESRLHAIIQYKRLDDSKRAKIWYTFFDKLKKDKKGMVLIGSQARKFVLENEAIKKLEWNGREIRNAFQTAVSLAEFEAAEDPNFDAAEPVVVESAHFERVCKMSKTFKDYMFNLKKADEQKRAHGRRDRLDYDQNLD